MGGAMTQRLGLNSGAPFIGAPFDSATKGANITLSNSDYTATKSSAGLSGAKTAYGKKTGKVYFEGVLTTRVSSSTAAEQVASIGLMRVDTDYLVPGIFGYGGVVYVNVSASGRLWIDRTVIVDLGIPSSGDVYGIAADLTNSLLWVRRNAGDWNGNPSANPATGTSGQSLGDLAGYALTPVGTFYNNTEAETLATSTVSLAHAAPAGFSSGWDLGSSQNNDGLGYTTFASVKNINITLSGGNLTATRSANNAIVYSRDPKSSGKQYIEFAINNIGGSDDGVGLCGLVATQAQVAGSATNACIVYKSGNIWVSGVSTGVSLGALANGDVISVAFDWTNLKVYFRKNGGNWNNNGSANPATNTGGLTYTNTSIIGAVTYTGSAMVPCATFGNTGTSGSNNFTLNAGASAFTYSVPSGFDAGWSVGPTP